MRRVSPGVGNNKAGGATDESNTSSSPSLLHCEGDAKPELAYPDKEGESENQCHEELEGLRTLLKVANIQDDVNDAKW